MRGGGGRGEEEKGEGGTIRGRQPKTCGASNKLFSHPNGCGREDACAYTNHRLHACVPMGPLLEIHWKPQELQNEGGGRLGVILIFEKGPKTIGIHMVFRKGGQTTIGIHMIC